MSRTIQIHTGNQSLITDATSASYARNADLLDGLNSTVFATTGSNTFTASQIISGAIHVTSTINQILGMFEQLNGSPTQFPIIRISRPNNISGAATTSSAALHILDHQSNIPLQISTHASASILTVSGSGNIGIGTSTPHLLANASTLTINNSGNGGGATAYQVGGVNIGIINGNDNYFTLQSYNSRPLSIGHNNNNTIVINTSNNVGIGTITPNAKLHVSGGISIFNSNNAGSDGNSGIRIVSPIATTHFNWMLGAQQNVSAAFEITPSTGVGGTTFSTPVAVFTAAGSVGIGTTSPGERLHVFNGNIRLQDTYYIDWSAGSERIRGGGGSTGYSLQFLTYDGANLTEKMRISGSGNVGIGTTTPQTSLDIVSVNNVTPLQLKSTGITGTGVVMNVLNGADSLLFRILGNGSTYIPSGSVGIGTLTPASNLHVSSSNNTTAVIIDIGIRARYQYQANSTSLYTTTFNMTDTGLSVGHDSAIRDFRLLTGNTARMTILGGGDVGIGTTTPGATLHVQGAISSSTIRTSTSGNVLANSFTAGFASGARVIDSTSPAFELWHDGNSVGQFLFSSNTLRYGVHSGNGVLTERLRIDSSGNIGIGTTSPNGKLHVTTGTNKFILVKDAIHDTLTSNLSSVISFSRPSDGSQDLAGIFGWNNGGLAMVAREGLVFATGGTSTYNATIERLRIDSSGNVGIGTSSPTSIFHIAQSVTTGSVVATFDNTHHSTSTAHTVEHVFRFRRDGGQQLDGAIVRAGKEGTWAGVASETKSYLSLLTRPDFTTASLERVRITSTGAVGIGITTPGATLHVQGNVSASSFTGSFAGTATTASGLTGGTTNYIPLWLSATQQSSSVIFQSSGNVSVGSTVSTIKLNVSADNPGNGIVARIHNLAASGWTGAQIQFTQDSLADWAIGQVAGANEFGVWTGRNSGTAGTLLWRITSAGHLLAGADNTYDIGASGATRPRDLFVGRNATVAGNLTVDTNTLFVDATNNRVGVGTVSPIGSGTTLNISVAGGASSLFVSDTSDATDQKHWAWQTGISIGAGVFRLRASNDAVTDGRNAYIVTRSGIEIQTHQWFTANTERMRLDSSGNLGLGSSSPSTYGKFVIEDTTNSDLRTYIRNNSSGSSAMASVVLNAFGNSWRMRIGSTANNNNALMWDSDVTSPSTRMTLTTAGNLGVGTTTPATPLHVQGTVTASTYTSNNGVYLGSASTLGFVGTGTSNDFQIRTSGLERIRVLSTGEVGIGTSTPTLGTLHVAGKIYSSTEVQASTALIKDSGIYSVFGSNSSGRGVAVARDANAAAADIIITGSTGFVGIGTANPTTRLTVNGSGNYTGSLDVTGAFTAQTKSFKILHQTQPGKHLVYGVLEGAEHAVYTRGKLENSDTIILPDEWTWLVDENSITVQLTPIGSHQKLYVESMQNNTIKIANENLFTKSIKCYYLVHAVRKDVSPLQIIV